MNKIEKLLNELCPDGIEFKSLEKVVNVLDNQRKPISKWNRTRWEFPYYWANGIQDYVDDYIFDWTFLLLWEDWSVINKDWTPVLNWATWKIWVNNHAHVLSENPEEALLRYVYFALSVFNVTKVVKGNIPKITQTDLKAFQIPIPPIEIQKEIVKILDTFTLLESELESELEARKKQYEYYRDDLLSFWDNEVEWKTLDDVCLSINAGWDLPEKYLKGQKEPSELFPYPIYSNWTDESALYGFTDSYKIDKEAITISARWTIGYHTVREPKFTPIVRLITCIPYNEIISTKFLNYILDKTEIWHSWWSIPQLTTPNVKKLQIPVPYKNWKPDLEKQQEIVAILDKFDALVNDVGNAGLHSLWDELKARRQQYEYYRNDLLSFKVLEK